ATRESCSSRSETVQPSVVADLDHMLSTSVAPGYSDRGSDRLAPGLEEASPVHPGHLLTDPFGNLALQRRGMAEDDAAIQLCPDRIVDRRVTVAERHRPQGVPVVDELPAAVVPHPAAFT